jgi:glutamate-1-semialdehyde 2,1-aminomutase
MKAERAAAGDACLVPSDGLGPVAALRASLIADSGDGCWLTDTTGRRHVDWSMGRGSLLLGYRRPEVEAAIAEQLARGTLFSTPHWLEQRVAACLHEMVPCAERVVFGKNGSDVCAAAVRVARAFTGKEGILHCGYHGFHDWYAAGNAAIGGVPRALRGLIHAFPYDDLPVLEGLLAGHGDQVAAVILEPVREREPSAGYLAGVRELTREHGALLVFDEMVTGFRLAPGGAQELYGVRPDLACFGKALANGMPLSALGGRADLMALLGKVGYGMTAQGEALSLAAASAALAIYRAEPIAQRVRRIGEEVRQRFAASARRHGVAADLVGHPAMLTLSCRGSTADAGAKAAFVLECRSRGVLTGGHLLASAAHDETAVDTTCGVFEAVLARGAALGATPP